MKFKKLILFGLTLLLLLFAMTAYADEQTSIAYFGFQDFENSTQSLPAAFSTHGKPTVRIAETEKGSSAEYIPDESSWNAVRATFTEGTKSSIKSMVYGFSIKFGGFDTRRDFNIKDSNNADITLWKLEYGNFYLGGTHKTPFPFSKNIWYDCVLEHNLATGYLRMTIDDGKAKTVIEQTMGEKNLTGIWAMDFATYLPNGDGKSTFIDNVYAEGLSYELLPFSSADGFAISGVSPNSGIIPTDVGSITISLNGEFTDEALAAAKFTLNGSEDYITTAEKSGNDILLSISDNLEYGKRYVLKMENLVGSDGKIANLFANYYTKSSYSIAGFEAIKDGNYAKASASIDCPSGEYDSAVLLTVVYKKSTGEKLKSYYDTKPLSADPAPFSVSIDTSAMGDDWMACSFIIDNIFNSRLLSSPKWLNN